MGAVVLTASSPARCWTGCSRLTPRRSRPRPGVRAGPKGPWSLRREGNFRSPALRAPGLRRAHRPHLAAATARPARDRGQERVSSREVPQDILLTLPRQHHGWKAFVCLPPGPPSPALRRLTVTPQGTVGRRKSHNSLGTTANTIDDKITQNGWRLFCRVSVLRVCRRLRSPPPTHRLGP